MKMRGITSWKKTSRLFCLALMLVFMIHRHIGTSGIQDQFLVFLKSREFLNDDLRGQKKASQDFIPEIVSKTSRIFQLRWVVRVTRGWYLCKMRSVMGQSCVFLWCFGLLWRKLWRKVLCVACFFFFFLIFYPLFASGFTWWNYTCK